MENRDIWLGSPSFRAPKLWSLLVSLLLYSQPETEFSGSIRACNVVSARDIKTSTIRSARVEPSALTLIHGNFVHD